MKLDTLHALATARTARQPVVRATRLADGAEALIYADRTEGALSTDGAIVAAARRALADGRSTTVEIAGGMVFLHTQTPASRLIVVGAVHIAQALAPMASMLEFDVTVIDPRRSFASDARFPAVRVLQDWPDDGLNAVGVDAATAVVTLTHDPKLDDPALEVALRSEAFYVGSLGSKRTHAKRRERLLAAGITDAQFARIQGPVGLSIGAKSPAEIAVSILAQIIEVRARRAEALQAAA
ncbi:MAG: xanthine dehydrogenase [Alphaproteobacteria bacterium]|nr:xanthine dehydrogenase [Alphaproteobacteria bacterium]